MPIEIPASIFNRWVVKLEQLAATDRTRKTENVPSSGRVITPQHVLEYLESLSETTTEKVDIDKNEPDGRPKRRLVAMANSVVLDPENTDEALARDVVRNAERLTGITLGEDTKR
jgi:hypothetical protein